MKTKPIYLNFKIIPIIVYILLILILSCNKPLENHNPGKIEEIGLNFILNNILLDTSKIVETIYTEELKGELKNSVYYSSGKICNISMPVQENEFKTEHYYLSEMYVSDSTEFKFNLPHTVIDINLEDFKSLEDKNAKYIIAKEPVKWKVNYFVEYVFFNTGLNHKVNVVVEFDNNLNPTIQWTGNLMIPRNSEFQICNDEPVILTNESILDRILNLTK